MPDFKMYYSSVVIKMIWYWPKTDMQTKNKMEDLHTSYFPATVSGTAMNVTEQVSMEVGCQLLWACAKEWWMVALFQFFFEDSLYLFPDWLQQSSFPPTTNEDSPQPQWHQLSVMLLILAILTGVRGNLKVVLTCTSIITKDGEHSFEVLLSHFVYFIH